MNSTKNKKCFLLSCIPLLKLSVKPIITMVILVPIFQLQTKYNDTNKKQSHLTVSFHTSMEQTSGYTQSLIETSPHWAHIKKLYDTHVINELAYSNNERIPKIIHQIWLGSALPKKYKAFQRTWTKHHPGWQYQLWTDKEVKRLKLINQKRFNQAKNYGEKSDILRYEIIYQFGGVYVDTDFECLGSFDLFHHCFDFYTGVGYGPGFLLYNGLIGSKSNHPILLECIQSITNKTREKNILKKTGPNFFTACFIAVIPDCTDRSVVFPVTYFYPWPYTHRYETKPEQIKKWLRPETVAIHHWHITWNKRRKKYRESEPISLAK